LCRSEAKTPSVLGQAGGTATDTTRRGDPPSYNLRERKYREVSAITAPARFIPGPVVRWYSEGSEMTLAVSTSQESEKPTWFDGPASWLQQIDRFGDGQRVLVGARRRH